MEHLLRAQWLDRFDGPAPALGSGESVPPSRIHQVLRIAGHDRGNYEWCRFHFRDRTATSLSHLSTCVPAWEYPWHFAEIVDLPRDDQGMVELLLGVDFELRGDVHVLCAAE